eukprot:364836-Chlamydomonas_euryale.AAC.13
MPPLCCLPLLPARSAWCKGARRRDRRGSCWLHVSASTLVRLTGWHATFHRQNPRVPLRGLPRLASQGSRVLADKAPMLGQT